LVHQLFVIFKKVSWNFWLHRIPRLKGSFIKLNWNDLLTIFWKKFVVASRNGNSLLIGWNGRRAFCSLHEWSFPFYMNLLKLWTPASCPGQWGLKRQLQYSLVHQLFGVFKKVSWNFWLHRSPRLKGSFIKLNWNNLLTIFWKKFVVASRNGNSSPIRGNCRRAFCSLHQWSFPFYMNLLKLWTPASCTGQWRLKRQQQWTVWYISYLSYLRRLVETSGYTEARGWKAHL
jgi:hypothetical protein